MQRHKQLSPMEQNHIKWLNEAVTKGARHIIDVCDTFDYDNYPVYVMPNEDLNKIAQKYNGNNMQRIEVILNVRAFFMNDWEDMAIGYRGPKYGTDDPFTCDVSDLLNAFYMKHTHIEDWVGMFDTFKKFWNLELEFPWKSDNTMMGFMDHISKMDDGETDVLTQEKFVEHWVASIKATGA